MSGRPRTSHSSNDQHQISYRTLFRIHVQVTCCVRWLAASRQNHNADVAALITLWTHLVRDGRETQEAVDAKLHILGVAKDDTPKEGHHLGLRVLVRPEVTKK